MDQLQISDKDVQNPRMLRQILQRSLGHSYDLLERIADLEKKLNAAKSDISVINATGGLTDQERQLLQSLAIGSTDNPVSAQNAVVPAVSTLPPKQSAVNGQLAYLTTDQHIYRFSSSPSPGQWVDIAASGGGVLSGTYAARPAAGSVASNSVYYATDREVAWLASGGNWIYLFGTQRATLASMPALAAGDAGYLFYATDYCHLWRWGGASWDWAPGEEGAGYFIFAVAAPYFTGANAIGACDGTTYAVAQYDGSTVNVQTPDVTHSTNGVTGGFFKVSDAAYAGGNPAGGGGHTSAAASAATFAAGAGATNVSLPTHTHQIGTDAGTAPFQPVYWNIEVYLRR